jgi:hypothetical protein
MQAFGINAMCGNGVNSIESSQGVPALGDEEVFQPAIVYSNARFDCGDLGRQMSSMLICSGSRESTSISLTELYTAKNPGLVPRAPHHRAYCGPLEVLVDTREDRRTSWVTVFQQYLRFSL